MAPTVISLSIPEGEVTEAKEAGIAFTGITPTATGKQILAATFNEIMRKWRNETKGQAQGGIT